ncbi:hypothetical protein [Pseudomonas syringae]|nr:hypothetical protein [Pseudomonas syringae]MCF5466407.1 hypothetical protein [Pseudomonas syringae]MCF5471500.1 hypothetical protein [Pseudomonas syringae]MCF5482205.1 hypothetical protein [Pseudomonas syringae]MCF5486087.1 hypothetical protein [Pseudomonas syringae]MCF5495060.1 hypothetical protein [Pseudomonas syringae]
MMGNIFQEICIIADTLFNPYLRDAHMLTINTKTLSGSELSLLKDAAKAESADQASAASTGSATAAAPASVKVSLSSAGITKAAADSDPNRDIKESDLPGNVKDTLIRIRELKQQIAEKMAELQAVMADGSLSPQARQVKAGSLQTALAGLNAGLMTANAALEKASNNGSMSDTQAKQAAVMSMKS